MKWDYSWLSKVCLWKASLQQINTVLKMATESTMYICFIWIFTEMLKKYYSNLAGVFSSFSSNSYITGIIKYVNKEGFTQPALFKK